MLITHCCFASKASQGPHQCSIIEDLERYKVAAAINESAISIYNDFYRAPHRRAVITNHQNPSLSGKIVQIEQYDIENGVYLARFVTNQSSTAAIDPGNLTSLAITPDGLDTTRQGSRTRDIVLQATDKTAESHTIRFDFGCFKAFYPCFDHSKLIQSDDVYRTFRLMTETVQKEREARIIDQEMERTNLMRSLSLLGHQELMDSLLRSDPFEHKFNFPFTCNDEMLFNCGRRVGIFDQGLDPNFDARQFGIALSRRRSQPVNGAVFRCLLLQQSLNDGAMNILMTWCVNLQIHAKHLVLRLTCSPGSLLQGMTCTCLIQVSSPNC